METYTATSLENSTMAASHSLPDSRTRDEERAVIRNASKGCPAAIEHLVDRYGARLFRAVHNITGNDEDTEEVVQNAFFKAFQNLTGFRGDSGFYTWLVRIAINEALMKKRSQRFKTVSIDNSESVEDGAIPREFVDWGPNPEQRYSQEELRRILESVIVELEPGYRIVFQLRDVEGLSTQETAQTLNLSLPAVKTRLRRARFQLRDSLGAYFQPAKHVSHRLGVRELTFRNRRSLKHTNEAAA